MMSTDHANDNVRRAVPSRINGKRILWRDFDNRTKALQIYNKGLEYIILSDRYEPCHQFVWCKDFLHDVVHASINNRYFEIYRFKYNPHNDPKPSFKNLKLAISNAKDKKFGKKIPSCLDFINQIEDKIGIPRTKIRKCINPVPEYADCGIYILQGNKRWIMSPPMLSLYTLLVRVGFSHFAGKEFTDTIKGIKEGLIKPYQNKDCKWITEVEPALYKIFRIGDKNLFYKDINLNYPSSMSIDTIHNRMGIIGYANDMIAKNAGQPVMMPYWHMIK